MSSIFRSLKLFSSKVASGKQQALSRSTFTMNELTRNFADTPRGKPTSKQIMVHGTENETRIRIRRARPADVPRILRFFRDNTRLIWPGLVNTPNTPNQNIMFCDYVSRTLAQGHSLLAEQQVEKRGWSEICGLALNTSMCPWDATILEKWARCINCSRSRRLLMFTAHCMRAPGLHDKYRVHNILQVVLVVPPTVPNASDVIYMLARNSIQCGRDSSFPLIRFDVTDISTSKVLDNLQLKREYEFNYDVLPNSIKIYTSEISNKEDENKTNFITIYTAFPNAEF